MCPGPGVSSGTITTCPPPNVSMQGLSTSCLALKSHFPCTALPAEETSPGTSGWIQESSGPSVWHPWAEGPGRRPQSCSQQDAIRSLGAEYPSFVFGGSDQASDLWKRPSHVAGLMLTQIRGLDTFKELSLTFTQQTEHSTKWNLTGALSDLPWRDSSCRVHRHTPTKATPDGLGRIIYTPLLTFLYFS